MRLRREIRSLSSDERAALVDAFLQLKKAGRWDHHVHSHHAAMGATVLPHEPAHPLYRNGAHRGPAFLPWHREFLLQLENDLQAINSSITIPFWNWTIDAALPDPKASPLWAADFMGGDGDSADENRVQTGPFAYAAGNWPIPDAHGGPALQRQFATILPTLPTADDVKLAMDEFLYDTPPYSSSPFVIGFRNRIEGWVTQRGDARVKHPGSQLHNRVHLWVGGSMVPMTSPNDPVFFLHHCFIDKLWADWQEAMDEFWLEQGYPGPFPHYNPVSGGPRGHNLGDRLVPWSRSISDVLSVSALDYGYEATTNQALFAASRIVSPFGVESSPFWAD